MDEELEKTARLLCESEGGKEWGLLTPEERASWIEEAKEFHAILGSPWSTDSEPGGSGGTLH